MEHLTLYVPPEHAAKLRAHAAANDRTVAGELRRAVRMYLTMIERRAGAELTEPNGALSESAAQRSTSAGRR